MKNLAKIAGLVAVLMIPALALQAQSTPIDTFDAAPHSAQANSGTPTASSSASDGSILGTERDIQAVWNAGANNIDVQAGGGSGLYEFSAGVLTDGTGFAVWDGVDGAAGIDCAVGLGGIDITAGGDDRIRLKGVSNDFAVDLQVTLFTDCANFCSQIQNVAALQSNLTVDFLYAGFVVCTGALDLTSIRAIALQVGVPIVAMATDVTIDMITTPVELVSFTAE